VGGVRGWCYRSRVDMLYVTHDKSEGMSFADSIVRMKNGQIGEIVVLDEAKLNDSQKAILI
jgi:ABC-type sugar transport system ATPase subunit